ncbi:uncharacterized protein N0V96_006549 [Colletotrichum fioriniae]|uniref:uncharacterized protein n=1 Tax=Colletotrichum fioriniae TaxID=710243 RepID=UPI0032DBD935|nr:hypothetical protein N0V96_006549 [Colletotrichum fioriniae]
MASFPMTADLTKDILIKALNDTLNVPEAPALNIFNNALVVNPTPNATFFDLKMLHAHNVIEHDGSLSRKDAIFDPTNPFDIPVIVGENAFLLAIFGDPDVAVANRTFLEYFFRNERFPVELGWSPNKTPIDAQLGPIVQDIIAQSPADVPLTFTPQTVSLAKVN